MKRNSRSEKSTLRRGRFSAVIAMVVALVAMVLQTGAVVGASTTKSNSKVAQLKPDLAFFKGKTINYINNTAAGSVTADQVMAIQAGMQHYLHATLNIEYSSTTPMLALEDQVYAAAPDGLTLGDLATNSVEGSFFTNTPTINFPYEKMAIVGSTHEGLIMESACAGSSGPAISSFAQLTSRGTQVNAVTASTGTSTLFVHALMNAWQVPVHYITGYTSTTVAPGCSRGDGNFASNSAPNMLNTSLTAMVPGARPILLTAGLPKGAPETFLKKVPTLTQIVNRHPPTTTLGKEGIKLIIEMFGPTSPGYVTYGPPGIPAARLLALQDAYNYAMSLPATKLALAAALIPPGAVTQHQARANYAKILKNQALMTSFVTQ